MPSDAVTNVLNEVGARLQRIRTQRDVTLTELAVATGISKSTLSRLEPGQRAGGR
jgi:transcriptional regulator with XRE-family HTH domain